MTFSRKVFLSVFVSSLLLGIGLIFTAYLYVIDKSDEDFVSRYKVFTNILGDTLTNLDVQTEALMLNAAKVVVAKDAQKGTLSAKELKTLRDDLGVTHIFVTNSSGKFIRSTNEDPKLIPNLFSFCEDYRGLITGKSDVEATPVIQPQPEPKPFKFLSLATDDKKRIIEIGMRVDFIGKTLAKGVTTDSNILSLSLFSPQGDSFGRFGAEGVKFDSGKINIPSDLSKPTQLEKNYKFYTYVKSSNPKCCQCDVAGTSKDGEYYYILESKVSNQELLAVQANIAKAFGVLAIINLIISFFLGKFTSKRLVKNIELAAKRVGKLKNDGNFSGRIDLDGDDEIAYLTNEFDNLLTTLESSQEKIVEAKKVEAKVQIAREVVHNIKSPLLAIEMLLASTFNLPENTKKVFENAVSEIKALVEKLSDKNTDFVLNMKSQKAKTELSFLPALLKEVVLQKQAELSGKNIEIHLEIKGDVSGKYVNLDPIEFKIILSNLINNAIEAYEDDQGDVFIKCYEESEACIVEVCDCGVGIPNEYIDKLGNEPISFKGKSDRGNGLIHAFRFIDVLGGKISIQSDVGKGSVIRIAIPRYMEHNPIKRNSFDIKI